VSEDNPALKLLAVGRKKLSCKPNEVCSSLPKQFVQYFQYLDNLSFGQEPNYAYLLSLFSVMMDQKKYSFDYKYDWVSINSQESLE
jgi:hypothetical protein